MNLIIIDDEIVICQGLSKMIESNGWGWSVAGTYVDPEVALETCDWETVQCVVMDNNMPNIEGISFAHILNEREFDIDIIFITAYSSFEFAQKAIDERPLSYLLKPISKESLRQSLEKARLSFEKKQSLRLNPAFIHENLNDLRKTFLGNVIFSEREYSSTELELYKELYDITPHVFALYEILTTSTYKEQKSTLRAISGDVEWYVYGHAYFLVIVFLYQKSDASVSDILAKIEYSYSVGETGITDLDGVKNAYQQYLPVIREHYGRYSVLSQTAEKTPFTQNVEEFSLPVQEIIRYIDENYSKPLSLQSIATAIYLHPTYLSNTFKKQTGVNLMNYINFKRIQEAKALLRDPTLKVSWIVERVGFTSRKYFEKVFKEMVGMTPTQYKQDIYLSDTGCFHN